MCKSRDVAREVAKSTNGKHPTSASVDDRGKFAEFADSPKCWPTHRNHGEICGWSVVRLARLLRFWWWSMR
jgi:hypothetical protein